MRAVVRMRTPFALLALVAFGFIATVKVCGPSDARARELPREGGAPLVTAVLTASESVSGGSPGDVAAGPQERNRHSAPDAVDPRPEPGAPDTVAGRGGLDMHDLSVWDSADGAPYIYLSFTPLTTRAFDGEVQFRTAVVEGEEIEVADVAPALDEAHIGVELDGVPVSVASLQWYYAGYGDLGGADVKYVPVCLLRAERPDLSAGEHDVNVRIEDVETGATGGGSATLTCGAGVGQL